MKVLPVEEALQKDRRLIQLFTEQEQPVYCVRRKNNTKKSVSFRALIDNNSAFWKTKGEWSFYLPKDVVEEALRYLREEDEHRKSENSRRRLNIMSLEDRFPQDSKDHSGAPHSSSDPSSPPTGGTTPPAERAAGATAEDDFLPPNFSGEYERIREMPPQEKSNLIYRNTHTLDKLLANPHRSEVEVGEALGGSTRDTTLVNKTILEDALKMGDADAKEYTRDIVERTRELVRSSTSLINESVLHDELFNSIIEKSNGTVVQHMTRTYLRSVSFLLYYNNKLQKTSFANKIRGQFPNRYREYYWKLLPHFFKDDVVLERVFQSGLQAVSSDQVHNFATGFLVHDVGKAKDIEYHEGDAAYDREKVVDHVREGYKAIMHKTDYPPQAGLITGYHHEYYGHPSGYGYHRAFYHQHKKNHPKANPGYCISYTVEGVLTFNTLAYFPAKLLEIIDVFDALTDPNRKYREPLSKPEALDLMQEQFIDEQLKIDPILFHIFREYVEANRWS